VCIWNWL